MFLRTRVVQIDAFGEVSYSLYVVDLSEVVSIRVPVVFGKQRWDSTQIRFKSGRSEVIDTPFALTLEAWAKSFPDKIPANSFVYSLN